MSRLKKVIPSPDQDILACGCGMQSTAAALMSCENALTGYPVHKEIPVYNAVLFCDLGSEAWWVYAQMRFVQDACKRAVIPFHIIQSNLYEDYLRDFGHKRVVNIPFWTIGADGKPGVMPRNCTLDYKVYVMEKYVRWHILGYGKGQWTLAEDKTKRHRMHIGFSYEERRRCKPS